MEYIVQFLISLVAGMLVTYLCKWLEEDDRQH